MMSEWMPIDSAPQWTRVLIATADKVGEARQAEDVQGNWVWCWSAEYACVDLQPTHWMPLPAPPAP